MRSTSIAENIAEIRARIGRAAAHCQRDPAGIRLLAASKTQPAAALRLAWDAGVTDFGESYVQEALEKQGLLRDLPLRWHFIGPLQSNKTRAVAENFDWVHSVDRLKIARRLSAQRPAQMPPLALCIQVNISAEPGKSGAAPGEVAALAGHIAALPGLELRGLMAIPRAGDSGPQQRHAFARLRGALSQLQAEHPLLDTLSMGMSADLEAAIEEGSTLVRVGTDLFGPRK